MTNLYERAARRYWDAYLPEYVAELADPGTYFRDIGERFLEAVTQAMLSTGPRKLEGEGAEELKERMAPLLLAARVAIAAVEVPSAPLDPADAEPTEEERFEAWVEDVSRFVALLGGTEPADGEPAPEAVDAIRPRVAELMRRAIEPAP
jgi:hypothetical protein